MIPDHLVEEVRARADLVEIIGEFVQLKRAGRDFNGLCPFHHEKTPSFSVTPAKGFYKCFGCGEAGDAFTFLMKREGLSFPEAVREVARRVGVEIPEDTARTQEEPNRELYEAVAFAADFYQSQLWEESAGERARAYLATRELTRETADRFGIGCAPDAWRSLRQSAHRHGIADEVLLAAGLIKASDKTEEPYDRLRDRLIFPIADLGGRWIAFGGRVLGKAREGGMKYLNSPETAIYQKGRMLYGLNWSRTAIRREHAALVVEGYMDYVSLAARGVENVVAGLGTALTEEQARLLARYSKQALLLYDSDKAGSIATFRAGDELLRAGVEPLVVTLPDREDPDSVVRRGGAAALAPYLARATDVLDRKLQILKERHFLDDSKGIRRALDRVLPTLRAAADPALKDIYVRRVAQVTGVSEEVLEAQLTNDRPFRGVVSARRSSSADRRASGSSAERAPAQSGDTASERLLLLLMLRDPDRISQASSLVHSDQIRDPAHRQIFEALITNGPVIFEPGPEIGLSVAAHQRLSDLRGDPLEVPDGDRMFGEAVVGIRSAGLRLTLDEVAKRLSLASASEKDAILEEHHKLVTERRELDVEKSRLGWRDTRQGRKGRKRPSPGGNG